jgi:hypothetical protein
VKSNTAEHHIATHTHPRMCGLSLSALESVMRWWCSYFAAAQHHFPHTRKNEVRAVGGRAGEGKKDGLCARASACTQNLPVTAQHQLFKKCNEGNFYTHAHAWKATRRRDETLFIIFIPLLV